MERLKPTLSFLCLLCGAMLAVPGTARTESFPIPQETAADIVPLMGRTALLRPGFFNSGAFPYHPSFPPLSRPVRVDGVPLPAFSPCGPDLERIPVLFTDSREVSLSGIVRVALIDSIPERPVTRIAFTSGERRRNRFQGTFHRKVTEQSAVLVGGATAGIRGNERIQGNGSRLYGVKYMYSLEKGGMVTASVSGGRDRLDLPDVPGGARMGERILDHAAFTAGVEQYPISNRTKLTSTLYYRNGSSRFERYDDTNRFDDDMLGGLASFETGRGNSRYTADFSVDTRWFEPRNAFPGWNDTVADLYGSGNWNIGSGVVRFGTGVRLSEEYGAGYALETEASFPWGGRNTVSLRGYSGHHFPGPGVLFYPYLTYSDTLLAAPLERYIVSGMEAGLVRTWKELRMGVFAFAAAGDAPRFRPENASMFMEEDGSYGGGRVTMDISGSRSVAYSASALLEYTGGSPQRSVWPRPVFRTDSHGSVSRYFFNRNLHAATFWKARLEHRVQSSISPEGTHFFLDLGISAQVGSVILFYQIENITDTNMNWFGVYESQGRNSFWGVRWNLLN